MAGPLDPMRAYRLRWKRRRLLWRAFLARRTLQPVADRTAGLPRDAILAFATVRNEARRLPVFLNHYRRLGVGHFLIVDHGSGDATAAILAEAADVSVWNATGGYRASRFGLDWLTWLQFRHGHGRWCLTVDADEILVYPDWERLDLRALIARLEARGQVGLGALMLDLYPDGPVGSAASVDPHEAPVWFDPGPYTAQRQQPVDNLWVQGGVRTRAFFGYDPRRAPTLNKLPLMRWNRRWAYLNSTHSMLPRHLNRIYDGPGDTRLSGVLLHTKFLGPADEEARVDKAEGEHFQDPAPYRRYYDAVIARPCLISPISLRYEGWRQLADLGLMSQAD
jgi:glycosyltransferase involved in cell wall biosynthesis